ncbi:50S ribosomal protein L25, partial [candidate division WWE3 bacterium CG10_big_fil_rev_8_21_14_0_10_32_10]
MKLSVQTRKLGTKGDVNKLRREGNIPGIIYSDAGAGTPISLSKDEMKAVVRNLQQPGILATTVFELNLGDKKQKVVVKDIQYHVVSYDILHMDFALLSDDKQVSVNVPITLDGKID